MKVKVTVPATTANLGPGFDCLGLALGLHNVVTLDTATAPGLRLSVTGEGADRVPRSSRNMVARAAELVFARVGRRPPGLSIRQQNGIPVGSGLGSSAAATLAGLLAANAAVGNGLSAATLQAMAIEEEGHPDNVAAAIHGGLALAVRTGAGWHIEAVPVPPMEVVIVLPDYDLSTRTARRALPAWVSRADAVFNASRVGLLVRALAAADYDRLALAMDDRLHQPYRLSLVPGLEAALTAGRAAGAAGVALSGAGPSLVAFAPDGHQGVAAAIKAAFAAAGLCSRAWILPVDQQGAQVETLGY